jgi:hypothetical protein
MLVGGAARAETFEVGGFGLDVDGSIKSPAP